MAKPHAWGIGRALAQPLWSVRRGDHQGLFQGGDAFANLVQGDIAQCFHALADGDLADLHRTAAGDDDFADFVGDTHRLDDGGSSRVAGIVAAIATASAMEDSNSTSASNKRDFTS